jgi:hypothetical protein
MNGLIKDAIVGLANEIGELNSKISDHWLEIQRSLGDSNRIDEAISSLNSYFRLKADLEGVEAKLKTMLHTHYPNS